MKKIAFLWTILMTFSAIQLASGQTAGLNSVQNMDFISNFKHLSSQQLLDTADYYFNRNSIDTALVCYSYIITPVKETDIEQQKRMIEAYNKSAIIYFHFCDYRRAYEYWIKALILCEKTDYALYESKIYSNIGNIYFRFKKYDIAKMHYLNALNLNPDTLNIIMLNNLGAVEIESGQNDSAFHYLNKSLYLSKQYSDNYLASIMNNIASLYQQMQCYDSAFYYFRLSLDETVKKNNLELKTVNLSCLGKLFFEVNKFDSAFYYINLSNHIAEENNFLDILSDNYLILSNIEESKENLAKAFKHLKKSVSIKDSIFNANNFGEITQLQRLYEVTKTNQQIEQLIIEQQIKEKTIHYQKIIQSIIGVIVFLLIIILTIIFSQKRKLYKAYDLLVKKNVEVVEAYKKLSEKNSEKYTTSALTDKVQDELSKKILAVMEDTPVICDAEFTVDSLVELVQSNQVYVSQTINLELNTNFRSLLNRYRIKEAQRLLSEPGTAKFTIEHVSQQVGFKSQTSFRNSFKEITGVSPNFYLKSMQNTSNS